MNEYDRGDVAHLTCAFTDAGGTATDPTTVTLRTRDGGGGTAIYLYSQSQVQNAGTGSYYKDLSVDVAGHWHYRWEGTGACATVAEGVFYVRPSNVI